MKKVARVNSGSRDFSRGSTQGVRHAPIFKVEETSVSGDAESTS